VATFTAYQRDPATGQVLFDANGSPLVVANSGANTYAQFQQRVAYETQGSPTANDVTNAIVDAIGLYDNQAFFFNDMRTFGVTGSGISLQTVRGKEFYSYQDLPVLISMPSIRQIVLFAFNNRYPLVERTQAWLDDQSFSPTWNGMPTDWCWQAGAIRLYPIPDRDYPMILNGTIRFPPLLNATDTNPWINEAELLIRSEAKRLLFVHITRDADQAMMMDREAQRALSNLRAESTRRAGGMGRLRASQGYL
jgi:hypothetical protein